MLWFGLLSISATGESKGKVTLYCAQDQVYAEPILREFTRETGIQVNSVFDSEAIKTVGLANRLLAEQRRPLCDLFWGNEELRTRQLAARGVFRPTNGWTAFGARYRVLVTSAKAPRVPQALRELTNDVWRGRVSLANPLFGSTATHFAVLHQAWGEAEWREWCERLRMNRPFLEEGNSPVVRRVAHGEAWVGLTDSDDVEAGRRQGFNVTILPISSDLLRLPNTVAVIRGAPHPDAAQKLHAYLLRDGVRRELETAGALTAERKESGESWLNPEWTGVLSQLDTVTAQLAEIFRR